MNQCTPFSFAHSQKKQLTQLYNFIFIWMSIELSSYSWTAGFDDDIQWSELVPLVYY